MSRPAQFLALTYSLLVLLLGLNVVIAYLAR